MKFVYKVGLVMFAAATSVSAQQSVRFTNVIPNIVVPLQSNTVTVSSTGSILASCQINSATNTCKGVSTSGTVAGNRPAVALSPSPFGAVDYPNTTQFTIARSITSAEVCRKTSTGPTSVSAWTGLSTDTSTAAVFTLPTAGTYTFSETCYNSNGSTVSNTVTITTVGPPPLDGCPTTPAIETSQYGGFTRQTSATIQSSTRDYTTVQGAFLGAYPITGAVTPIGVSQGKYAALEFTTPANSPWYTSIGNFDWLESQGGGVFQADLLNFFVIISKCPGDFNLDNRVDQAGDPASFKGCRNIRGTSAADVTRGIIFDDNGISTNNVCGLQPNTRYFVNMINANPTDGISPLEHSCGSSSLPCGFQARMN